MGKKITDQAQQAFERDYKTFCEKLHELGYRQKINKTGKKSNMVAASPDCFEYNSNTGYSVEVYPGVVGSYFGEKISASVLIVDKNKKELWGRQFRRFGTARFFTVLEAYAMVTKRTVDERPMCGKYFAHLQVKTAIEHCWVFRKKEIKPFSITGATYDVMNCSLSNAVFRKEYFRKKYFRKKQL